MEINKSHIANYNFTKSTKFPIINKLMEIDELSVTNYISTKPTKLMEIDELSVPNYISTKPTKFPILMKISKPHKPHKPPKQQMHYDGDLIASQFIAYFYQTWISNPETLLNDGVIKSHTKLKYNNNMYKGPDFIEHLKMFSCPDLQFIDCNSDIIDSGSRQIYILVTGTITNLSSTYTFSQSFVIVFATEIGDETKPKIKSKKWILNNSILIIKQ